MDETTRPETSKLETAKNVAETITFIATTAVAVKGLWDVGVSIKEAIEEKRRAKAEAED